MQIPEKEVLRYLGYAGEADSQVMQMVDTACKTLLESCQPKSVYQIYPLCCAEGEAVRFGGMDIASKNLYKNLLGCEQVVLLGATLGAFADILIKKFSKIQMSMAVVYQAAAAAMIEEYCDLVQEEIRKEAEKNGYYLRPRFSPGYGDFSIFFQTKLLALIEAPKRIGLSATDSLILTPTKSVTAIIGLSKTPQSCHKKGCEECLKTDCAFRRS